MQGTIDVFEEQCELCQLVRSGKWVAQHVKGVLRCLTVMELMKKTRDGGYQTGEYLNWRSGIQYGSGSRMCF